MTLLMRLFIFAGFIFSDVNFDTLQEVFNVLDYFWLEFQQTSISYSLSQTAITHSNLSFSELEPAHLILNRKCIFLWFTHHMKPNYFNWFFMVGLTILELHIWLMKDIISSAVIFCSSSKIDECTNQFG